MKKVDSTWLYIIGTLIIFGIIVLFATDQFIPRIFNRVPEDYLLNLRRPTAGYIDRNLDYLAKITTNIGIFHVDLLEDSAPHNVANFVYLSRNNYYNTTSFHRLVPNFLLQGGDRNTLNDNPDDDGLGKTSYFIKDEINWSSLNLNNERINYLNSLGFTSDENLNSHRLRKYSIAMANSGPNTNSSQFFIVLCDDNDPRLSELQGQYTVIGQALDGFELLNSIASAPVNDPTTNSPRPLSPIIIESIEIFNP